MATTTNLIPSLIEQPPFTVRVGDADAIAEYAAKYAKYELSTAWANHKRNGMEFGRVCSEYRTQFKAQGTHTKMSFVGILQSLGIPRHIAYYWADKYEGKNAGTPTICSLCGETFPSKSKYKEHRHREHPAARPEREQSRAEATGAASAASANSAHKNPAVDQLNTLRKRFAEHENVKIERVGGADMSTFEVVVDNILAKSAPRGQRRVMVEMTTSQLRTVRGNVSVGANGLTSVGVEEFLASLGIK